MGGPDMTMFLRIASGILYNLTEGAYPGVCTDTIRPPSTCGCVNRCRCGWVSEITLPGWPVVEITEVLIDGEVVDPARYRVDNHRSLVWIPDTATGYARGWPRRQDADAPATAEHTWQVEYTYGAAPPPEGVWCAAVLAVELALDANPELRDKCRLPKNTVSLTKKNVGHAMADPAQLAERGETGLPEVDLWIRSDRWARSHRGGTAWSPRSAGRTRRATS